MFICTAGNPVLSTPNGLGASPEPAKMRPKVQMAGPMAGQRQPMTGQVAGQVHLRGQASLEGENRRALTAIFYSRYIYNAIYTYYARV